jgi:hypothetical protein
MSSTVKSFLLRPLYARAVEGLPLLGSPIETAGRFMARPGTLAHRVDEMSQAHLALCTSTGFVCGLGGFITLPVTLPANVIGVALVQLHFCAATAFLAGEDLSDPDVRERCIRCVTGALTETDDRDEAQEIVDRSAVKIAERGLRFVAETALGAVDAAGRFATRRFVFGKLPRRSLPIIGGFIGGASDLYATRRVIAAARAEFLEPPAGILPADEETVAANGAAA